MAENANTFPSISPVSFPQARTAALRVLTAPALAGRVYLQGGLVPWAASGRDSGRPHGDVDVSVRLGDMPVVRTWLAAEGLRDPALDSLELPCNDQHGDFGIHVVVDGVLVSFMPFVAVHLLLGLAFGALRTVPDVLRPLRDEDLGAQAHAGAVHNGARTYHDGKRIMFEPIDNALFGDFMRLLAIKRRSNRKPSR